MSFAGLAAGARVDVARTFDGTELLPLLRGTRPSLLCMLPAPLFGLGARPRREARGFSDRSGGAFPAATRFPAELEHEYTALTGHAIEEMYGMTETGTATIQSAVRSESDRLDRPDGAGFRGLDSRRRWP